MSLAEFDEIDFTHSAPRLDRPSDYLMKKARRREHGLQDLRDSYQSGCVYVGNLSFYTTEEQIYELFSKVGPVKQIIMGLDRFHYTPCGFCFVIYKNPQDAVNSVKYLGDTKLEDRLIQIDLDPGFEDGRQFGRGQSGGQVKDELRFEYDSSRGPPPPSIIPAGGVQPFGIQDGNSFDNFNNLPANQRFGARRINNFEKTGGDSYIPGQTTSTTNDDDLKQPSNEYSNATQEAGVDENQDENIQDAA